MDRESYTEKIDEAFLTLERGEVYRIVIGSVEKVLIEKALERSYGNQILAAKLLGLNRNTLRAKIRKFHIDVQRFK